MISDRDRKKKAVNTFNSGISLLVAHSPGDGSYRQQQFSVTPTGNSNAARNVRMMKNVTRKPGPCVQGVFQHRAISILA
jgi:hypothetical protein